MRTRGLVGIMTWVVATLIAVSLAWVVVSDAVVGSGDPIPNITGRGKGGAPVALAPALEITSSVDASPGAETSRSSGSTAIVPAGATGTSTDEQSFPGGADRIAGPLEPPGAPESAGAASDGEHGAGTGSGRQPDAPASAGTTSPHRRGVDGTDGGHPRDGTDVPEPAPTTTPAPGWVKSSDSPDGTITVRCTANSIELVSAAAQGGQSSELGDTRPDGVHVNAASSSDDWDTQARCQRGVPAASVDD